jgi:precorrin-3B methylase
VIVTELGSVTVSQLDMGTIVIVGSRATRRFDQRLVTPRGYQDSTQTD